jgi:hypothetical protein
MNKTKSAVIGIVAFASVVLPLLASAQAFYPYQNVQVQILTQVQGGTALPSSQSTVTIYASNVSLNGVQMGSGSASYSTSFQNDTHTATFTPGSYNITATPLSGYTYSYSPGCQGTGYQTGLVSCIITASTNSSSIGTAQLIINTEVNSFSSFGGILPSNFFLTIVGNSPSPSTVQVSNNTSGTTVALQPGTFSVNAPQLPGWQVSRSGICDGFIQSGQSVTCHIEYSFNSSAVYPYNNPYNSYPYNSALTCLPAYQQIAAGQSAQFTATGGIGTYVWATSERNYQNAGAVLNTIFQGSGLQTVVVSSGSQTATCMVNIVAPGSITYTNTYNNNYPTYGGGYTTGYIPTLPNTGFEPHPGVLAAFAAVILIAALFAIAPYVRRAIRTLLA